MEGSVDPTKRMEVERMWDQMSGDLTTVLDGRQGIQALKKILAWFTETSGYSAMGKGPG